MTAERHVHIVDDDPGVRRSTGLLLAINGYSPSLWPSAATFFAAVASIPSGCVLLDIRMPEIDGLSLQRMLNETGARMPVVILTGHGDVDAAVRAMKAGAVDFLEKPVEKAVLVAALDVAFERLFHVDGDDMARRRAEQAVAGLTDREREVLGLLAHGASNKSIALELDISPRTVEVHRANLMAKLPAGSLSAALRIAFSAGMGPA